MQSSFLGILEEKGGGNLIKGISRQVIVVHSQDKKLFEQAIFFLSNDGAGKGVTDEMLLQEARLAIRKPKPAGKWEKPLWACGGAGAMGLIWLLCVLL